MAVPEHTLYSIIEKIDTTLANILTDKGFTPDTVNIPDAYATLARDCFEIYDRMNKIKTRVIRDLRKLSEDIDTINEITRIDPLILSITQAQHEKNLGELVLFRGEPPV